MQVTKKFLSKIPDPIVKTAKLALALPFAFHYLNGVRHLVENVFFLGLGFWLWIEFEGCLLGWMDGKCFEFGGWNFSCLFQMIKRWLINPFFVLTD